MNKSVLEDLDQVFSLIKQQLDRKDPSKVKTDAKIIGAKIQAALKTYPTWAQKQRQINNYKPPAQVGATDVAQTANGDTLPTPNLKASPTSIAGYDQKRAAAAKRAQADMKLGAPPVAKRKYSRKPKPSKPTVTQGSPNIGNSTTPMSTLIRQRQSSGMTEGKFSHLYALLENALYEQQDDPGSFSNFLKTIIKFDPKNSDPIYKQQIQAIDKLYQDNKKAEAEQEAVTLLDLIFKTQLLKSRNATATTYDSIIDDDKTKVNKILNDVRSNYYDQNELNNIILYSLLVLRNKYPQQFRQITADIDSTLDNYQKQIS